MALLGLLGVAAPPASGQSLPELDVRVERDTRPGAVSSALVVNLKVSVTDRPTGSPPADDFEVYAFADQPSGSRTEIFPCAQEHDNSPEAPRGVYLCTVLVDHGGRWQFSASVNRLRANADDPPVTMARAATEFDIVTAEVAPEADPDRIRGRAVEVALLWSHAGAAGLWLVAAGLVGLLALPTLRRRLSPFGLHRLEDRFDLIAKSLWTATGLLVASGTYLLLNQTAYETPFSSDRIEAAFRLPYGRPYFLTLAAKLTLYTVMIATSAGLLREARHRLRSAVAPAAAAISPWQNARPAETASGPPLARRGGTGTVVAAPPAMAVIVPDAVTEPEPPAPVIARCGAAVLIAGTVGLSLSITLLKYFHELIEAARAAL